MEWVLADSGNGETDAEFTELLEGRAQSLSQLTSVSNFIQANNSVLKPTYDKAIEAEIKWDEPSVDQRLAEMEK